MLAERIEIDVFHNYHLPIVFGELCRIEYADGIFVIASGQFCHCTRHAPGRLLQSFSFAVFTKQFQNSLDVLADCLLLWRKRLII